jgi:hypothetical protein
MADLEVSNPCVVDLGREQKLQWVEPKNDPVGEFDQREPVVEDFKRRFLTFAIREMSDHEHRLAFAFGMKIFQRVLRGCGARIVAA